MTASTPAALMIVERFLGFISGRSIYLLCGAPSRDIRLISHPSSFISRLPTCGCRSSARYHPRAAKGDHQIMRSVITGSGIGIPKNVVPNALLARVMDTSDEWIRTRSGIEQRYYAEPGQGSSDLGMMAADGALRAAGREKSDIDAIIFATMTPDYLFPGNGPVVQAKMGFPEIPTFDIRQQCSGFLYGLDLADSLIQSRKFRRILLIGAEVHTAFMPWQDGWDVTIALADREVTADERARNTNIRPRTVRFGHAAGAVVVEAMEEDGRGLLASKLYSD